MSDFILLILILVLVVCITVTIAAFVLYSGLLSDVVIKTGPPPIKNVTIAYKFKEGPYKDCGAAYTESCSIGPKLSTIAIFYDDPKQPADQCRYIVGSILSEGEEKPNEELQKLYEKFGFKVFSLPEVSHAVTSSFPCTSPLSHVVAPNRVYPQLAAYIQERKLSAFPYIEICNSDSIQYMVPLSRQTDFFVPEVKEEPRMDVKEEDSDEDRGTDITGADSHSDVSSVSGGAPWDSRETSLAASTAASLASSLPLRDVPDLSEEPQLPVHRGSNVSTGSSGSSFEELDMDNDEQEAERQEEDVDKPNQEEEQASGDKSDEKEEVIGAGEE
ncbi:LOW QUALITY PROTEIN: testis-expressed protein 264 homolog [Boleophthalmus pectinirostris]|uniref:LOW QUALITY PROTEIN: testis-expressed protein 264 homolog n=1 Tax=Boleophthalmus pectinirostris TaxID=150288 RepID=UPI000A1C55FB|nr:LOW QUALITY PROTEIN: testis-expressed protein 264 homolog [Boleophthalmus pectinirostris]